MNVDFICCADMHLTWKIPAARKDKFIDAQWRKVKFIADLQKEYKCAVLNAGDIFDTWKSDPDSMMLDMLYMADKTLPYPMFAVYGQHEMPEHSIRNKSRSPLNLLHAFKRILIIDGDLSPSRFKDWWIYGCGYGDDREIRGHPNSVLLIHKLVWKKEEPFPGAPREGNVFRVMDQYPNHRLIVSGDNHIPFYQKRSYRTLINCGSMMRRTIAQKKYKPCVWLYSKYDGIKRVLLPIEEDVWNEETKVTVAGTTFEVLKTIESTKTTSNDFEANVKKQMKRLPHPAKLKVKKLLGENQ